jgi:hypothetical protein
MNMEEENGLALSNIPLENTADWSAHLLQHLANK